jgi:hypothetical protein
MAFYFNAPKKILIKPNEAVELDTLFLSHNEKTTAWDAYSTHWNWRNIGYKRPHLTVSIAEARKKIIKHITPTRIILSLIELKPLRLRDQLDKL